MHEGETRRAFLKTTAGLTMATPLISRISMPSTATKKFDPDFGTAEEAVRAIREGVISSVELTKHTYRRIKKFNPKINAFITLMEEQALERARKADEASAKGNSWGPLHGLPILLKDTFAAAGVRTTSGSKILENYIPTEDAVAVARLKRAGAVILGKTNMPEFAMDLQSYNEVAGTTNNPWNLGRTPGGSTGGGAAALAAGFGFLELGSDIGGSIRTPCHFCGIYGHKPTLNVVPLDGHIPPPPGKFTPVVDLPVAGPMARSAPDLRLALEILGGPGPAEQTAYGWNLPPVRRTNLKDYKIGYVLDDSFCPVSSEVKDALSAAVEALRKHGVELSEGWPEGVDPKAQFENYARLLSAFTSPGAPEEELQILRDGLGSPWGHYAKLWIEGADLSHARWIEESAKRLRARAVWQEYFKTHDAFLMPVNIVPAFAHDHNLTFFERTVQTSDGERLYGDMLQWNSFAVLTGCPATAAPIGKTKGNLPVGIQIMGPYLEDATTIDLAARMADVVGGFEAPPGYAL